MIKRHLFCQLCPRFFSADAPLQSLDATSDSVATAPISAILRLLLHQYFPLLHNKSGINLQQPSLAAAAPHQCSPFPAQKPTLTVSSRITSTLHPALSYITHYTSPALPPPLPPPPPLNLKFGISISMWIFESLNITSTCPAQASAFIGVPGPGISLVPGTGQSTYQSVEV